MVLIDEMNRSEVRLLVAGQSAQVAERRNDLPVEAAVVGAQDQAELADHPAPFRSSMSSASPAVSRSSSMLAQLPPPSSVLQHSQAADDPAVQVIDEVDIPVMGVDGSRRLHFLPRFAAVLGPDDGPRFGGADAVRFVQEIDRVQVDGGGAVPLCRSPASGTAR